MSFFKANRTHHVTLSMEKYFISKSNQQRLILTFLGWGTDATPFQHLHKPGYDILALYDYADFTTSTTVNEISDLLTPYHEIIVVAWSFGVRIANTFLRNSGKNLPITHAIAINGTTFHIHDTHGIPTAIFNGTLQNLSPASIRKFERRMFASAADFAEYQQTTPQRTFESRLKELQLFGTLPTEAPSNIWDRIIIGSDDLIFPTTNQLNAWENHNAETIDTLPHFPNLQHIIDKYVIDKDLVAKRFTDALPTYRNNASVQTRVAQQLWQLTEPHVPTPSSNIKILEIGIGHGLLTEHYIHTYHCADTQLWDIAYIPAEQLPRSAHFTQCDAETAIKNLAPNSVDLILSSSTLQWFNAPTNFLKEVCRVLSPNGIAAIALYGPGTYQEIADITGETLKYLPIATLADAISPNAQIIESIESTEQETFSSVTTLLQHIKQTGVNAINRGSNQNSMALKLLRNYPTTPNGSAIITYKPIYLIFKKKA